MTRQILRAVLIWFATIILALLTLTGLSMAYLTVKGIFFE